MTTSEQAAQTPQHDLPTAQAHLSAYFNGGDELGEVPHADAVAALESLNIHVARMQCVIGASSEVLTAVESLAELCKTEPLPELVKQYKARIEP